METCVLDAFTTIPLKHTPRGVCGTEPCLGELPCSLPRPTPPRAEGWRGPRGTGITRGGSRDRVVLGFRKQLLGSTGASPSHGLLLRSRREGRTSRELPDVLK